MKLSLPTSAVNCSRGAPAGSLGLLYRYAEDLRAYYSFRGGRYGYHGRLCPNKILAEGAVSPFSFIPGYCSRTICPLAFIPI